MALPEIKQQTPQQAEQPYEEKKPVIAPANEPHAFTPEYQFYLQQRIIAQNLARIFGPIPKNETIDIIPYASHSNLTVVPPINKLGNISTHVAPNVIPTDKRPPELRKLMSTATRRQNKKS